LAGSAKTGCKTTTDVASKVNVRASDVLILSSFEADLRIEIDFTATPSKAEINRTAVHMERFSEVRTCPDMSI
jgi:hypothetical protein